MTQSRATSVALIGLALAGVIPAHADDAYVCDGGRLVYARPETIEKLKETDPCVAAYWRPTAAVPAGIPAAIPAPAREPIFTPILPPDGLAGPKAKPARQASRSKPAPQAAPGAPSVADRVSTPAALHAPELRAVRPAAPQAAIDTDFRNIRIINAGPGTPIYRHDR